MNTGRQERKLEWDKISNAILREEATDSTGALKGVDFVTDVSVLL
jgi:hypothetical protein